MSHFQTHIFDRSRRSVLLVAAGLLVAISAGLPLRATEPIRDRDYLGVVGGLADILDRDMVLIYGFEYRWAWNYQKIHPQVLVVRGTDGATYVGAAAFYDFKLSDDWRITVSSGPGHYERNRSSKDLGSSIEFYSNIELSHEFPSHHRLAVSFGHISNGSIGNENPGSETLNLIYLIPLR